MRTLSLPERLWGTAIVAFLGSLTLLFVSYRTIEEIKIRGPLYQDIVSYKDLVADILPPPEYLIESYLICFELLKANGQEHDAYLRKLEQLERDYLDRHQFWVRELTHAGLRKALLEESTPPALEFFRVMRESYLPQVRQGNADEAAGVLYGPLTANYRKHRAGIDTTVELSGEEIIKVESKADERLAADMWFLYLGAAAIDVVVLLLTFLAVRSILMPMRQLSAYASKVAKGDYDAVCHTATNDELGKLAEVLKDTVGAVKESIAQAHRSEELAQAEARNARNAVSEAQAARAQAECAKAEGMVQAAEQLVKIVEVVSSASGQLAAQVEESSRGAGVQSQRATETATAMDEMNSTVLEVARNATRAAESTEAARQRATEGARIVSEVMTGIDEVRRVSTELKGDMAVLGTQVEGIGQIMDVINDIADQTNLLALNAAIEAARAGDAGRGFAVVADEVRKLAEKTMHATREVGEAIVGIQAAARKNIENVERSAKAVEHSTVLAGRSGEALKDIVCMVETATDQVRGIATSSEQQSAVSEEINHSILDINRISGETAGAMRQSAHAVGDLSKQAQTLLGLIEKMKCGG